MNYKGVELQPSDVRALPKNEREALIVSTLCVDGNWVILSHYGDDTWELKGFTSNTCYSQRLLEFGRVPLTFRTVMKDVIYRYLMRGREGQVRPDGSTIRNLLIDLRPFLQHLEEFKIDHLSAITPVVCASYVHVSLAYRQSRRKKGKQLSQGSLVKRFSAVEALYELSQYTDEPIPYHPWPETSATALAGAIGNGSIRRQGSKTPLIPDDVFCTQFERAYETIQQGKALLDIRDTLTSLSASRRGQPANTIQIAKNRHLSAIGWKGGLSKFNKEILNLRTACYIVLASTSGCRNHELANLQSGAHRRTQDDDGNIYHWMRSVSEKTDVGEHDWMIPEAGVRALRIMERWAEPLQATIGKEILDLRKLNPRDPEIAHAKRHRTALFLGASASKKGCVRTMSVHGWNSALKDFMKNCALDWQISSHQYRRKFANYVAHSRFGDLRYLREHYAHWSMDMTLGYAMDEGWGSHIDTELFDDIQSELEDIKLGVVETWLGDQPLTGGYGHSIKKWRRDPINLAIFKSHSALVKAISESTTIRSNGHAWCTAGDDACVGNNFERTRCGDCTNAVIGLPHVGIYQGLYSNLQELLRCEDIGEGGRQRVLRDIARCREVLAQLGYDPEKGQA